MARYRFKTEQEFREGGKWGGNWDTPYGWTHKMTQIYLGQDIPNSLNSYMDDNVGFHYDEYWFVSTDYVLKTDIGGITYDIY
jgi:hypothetical protein